MTLNVDLTSNDLLLACVNKIASGNFDRKTLIALLRRRIPRDVKFRGQINLNKLPGVLLEVYLLMQIGNMTTQDLGIKINPVDFSETDNYRFFGRDHVKVSNRETGLLVTEYDLIASIRSDSDDPLIVVFEAKMGKFNFSQRRGKGELMRVLKTEHINSIFVPLVEYFHTQKFGYVVVVPSETVRPKSTVQRDFLTNGGILVEVPWTFHGFKELAFSLLDEL